MGVKNLYTYYKFLFLKESFGFQLFFFFVSQISNSLLNSSQL